MEKELTTCGHVKTFSPLVVSTDGSSNTHCFVKDTNYGDTEIDRNSQGMTPNDLINSKATKGK